MTNADGKVTWVIDNIINERERIYELGQPTLAEAARAAGHDVIETKYVPFRDRGALYGHVFDGQSRGFYNGDGSPNFDDKRPVIFHGSHEFIRSARNTDGLKKLCPLAYCREENLRFSTFAAHHGDDMLSQYYNILPYGEVKRRFKDTKHSYFIRPNEVTKAFTGRVIEWKDFAHEINSLNNIEKIDDETLVVMASPRQILGEFRFVVADGEVVTGSEYRWDNKLDIRIDVDAECEALAKKVAAHPWQPDRVYVVDIGLEPPFAGSPPFTAPRPRIIEFNSFSCAGLYACDTNKIVEKVSRAANKEYFGLD